MENKNIEEMLREVYGSLTEEQKKQVMDCSDPDHLLELAAEWGIELPDEVLKAVSGGYLYSDTDFETHTRYWQVVDENDKGRIVSGPYYDLTKAESEARSRHLSTDTIGYHQLKKLQGRKC